MLNPFWAYLLEATVYQSTLYLFYRHLFYRQTYFEWNRLFLWVSALISLVLPLIEFNLPLIESVKFWQGQTKMVMLNPFNGETLLYVENAQNFSIAGLADYRVINLLTVSQIILIIYLSGVIRSLFTLLLHLLSVRKLIAKSRKVSENGYTLVYASSTPQVFSFFKYVFLNSDFEKLNSDEQKQVMYHEFVHASQWHTADILFFEIYSAFFWFNPLIISIKDMVREIHEYIADAYAAELKGNYQYSNLLLNLSIKKTRIQIVSYFSKNQIKNRITMLATPESDKLRKLRFLTALPVIILILFIFGFTKSVVRSTTDVQTGNEILRYPVDTKFKIVQGFFINRRITEVHNNNTNTGKDKYEYLVSHPEITIRPASFAPVFAVADGEIMAIEKIDNWGVNEITITIKHSKHLVSCISGLYTAKIVVGATVKKGDTIATTGDTRLYPIINYQLLKHNKPVDPMKYFSDYKHSNTD